MDKQKLNYFRDLLLEQLRTATEDVRADQTTALQGDDGVKDTGDMSELDVNKSTGLQSRRTPVAHDRGNRSGLAQN